MPIDIPRVSIRDQDRLVASVPGPSLLYAADGTGGASSSLPNLVVSLPTVATNEVVEISLPVGAGAVQTSKRILQGGDWFISYRPC